MVKREAAGKSESGINRVALPGSGTVQDGTTVAGKGSIGEFEGVV